MPILSSRVNTLQESPIRKLVNTALAQKGVDFHYLNIGQPDVRTPAPLLDAVANFQPEVVGYGHAMGEWSCREAAAAYHSRWGPGLTGRDVAVTVGGSEALLFAFTAVADRGGEILVPEPFYANYNGFALMAGAKIVPMRTTIDDGFSLPPDAVLDAAITPNTRAILFSNPCNPTGAVYSKSEIGRLLAWAARRKLWVISDEVYRRIWFENPAPSALEFPEAADRVIVVDSLSKTYSACGARVGFLISRNQELMVRVERLGQARLGPQPLGQKMAEAALALPDSYYSELRRTYKARVDVLFDALKAYPEINAPKPTGAFYTMLKLPVPDADRFARFLVEDFRVENRSVVLAPGSGFYASPASGRDEVRLAAVITQPKLRDAVEIIGEGLRAFLQNS